MLVQDALQNSSDKWQPVGVKSLEPNALEIVKSQDNRCVIAGPGAGKTELLAQRADYLLKTGKSRGYQRILAISFKKDAATNLAKRVQDRSPSFSRRFDSMTFDAFAKNLLDHFRMGIPQKWRPTEDYEIIFPNPKHYCDFFDQFSITNTHSPQSFTSYDFIQIDKKKFEKDYIVSAPLSANLTSPAAWAANKYWNQALHTNGKSHLSFPMIAGLIGLLLRDNEKILKALRLTYSHVFLDEFQDTTAPQYKLLKTLFFDTDTIITAVGDPKQRIMGWAGALKNAFENFKADFHAKDAYLISNYRSSSELVQIQHILADALEKNSIKTVSKTKISGNSCEIWHCANPISEQKKLINFIQNEIQNYNLKPNDFALIVRQKADEYEANLNSHFKNAGIYLRNEAKIIRKISLQDLLTEEASILIISILRLTFEIEAAKYWAEVSLHLAQLKGILSEDEKEQRELSKKLDEYIQDLKKSSPSLPSSLEDSHKIIKDILKFIDVNSLRGAYPAYSQGDWFDKVISSLAEWLFISCKNKSTWTSALDEYEGLNSIPLMTIHKSKGLEYHTVIFIGLEDNAWWSFKPKDPEGTASFFVAFTRAKQRMIFTYCPSRGDRQTIAPLYNLLKKANVPEIPIVEQ